MDAPTKDVTIGETKYQVGRLSARDGSWLVGQFLPNMAGAFGKEIGEKELGLALAATLRSFSEDNFYSIQGKALGVVRRYDSKGNPVPLLMTDGRLVYDPGLVELTALTVTSLAFNLHCFFEPGATAALSLVFPDLNLPLAPG